MFDAIEDIPTDQLLTELLRRKNESKCEWLVWNDYDPNQFFYVDAPHPYEAALIALNKLGWCLSSESVNTSTEDDTDMTDLEKSLLNVPSTGLREMLSRLHDLDFPSPRDYTLMDAISNILNRE